LLPCILFEKYIYILALEMASPGNQHCANCIGTLSFPTLYRRYLADLKTKSRLLGGAEFRDSTRPSVAGCGQRSSNTSQRARQVLASRQGDVVSQSVSVIGCLLFNCWHRSLAGGRSARPMTHLNLTTAWLLKKTQVTSLPR